MNRLSSRDIRLVSPARGIKPATIVCAETVGWREGQGDLHLRADQNQLCEMCGQRGGDWTDRDFYWGASKRACPAID